MMNNHKQYSICNTLIIVVLLGAFHISSLDIFDISDFTLYYKTYHYTFDSLATKKVTYYNDELHVNITIDLSFDTITLSLNNINHTVVELNALNDNNWNEISNIQSITNEHIPFAQNRISRLLLGGCGGCGRAIRRAQRLERVRARKRARFQKAFAQRQRMRRKWRKRLTRIRRRKGSKLKLALRKLKRKEQGDTEYGWIADVLQQDIGFDVFRRRTMTNINDKIYNEHNDESDDISSVDIVSQCKVINNGYMGKHYQICVNYDVYNDILQSFEIKYGTHKVFKTGGKNKNYREIIESTQSVLDKHSFNPIKDNLGYMISKYEAMDWHSFDIMNDKVKINKQYEYGQFNMYFNDYIYYFDEYELDMRINENNMRMKCSQEIEDLPFKICMEAVYENGNMDMYLYFENGINDDNEILYNGNGFTNDVFAFNNDSNWDEINIIYLEDNTGNSITKCSHKLMIATICIEQFDARYYRASIKLNSKQPKHN